MSESHKASTSSSRSSQRFGPYVVGETIGRGTFAKVKIAVHETTKVRVALKIIPRRVMENDAHSALKIKREIKVMKVLRHPHITRLYDVVQTKHDIVLVLEFISGGELFDYISRKGRLDEPTARSLFQQLAGAVAYCHRYRVTHRDIKPENIMMEHGSHNIKLSDFGLSSITHDGRFFETSCGTPNYASPEVVSGQLYGGPETDVWSCGVVLYAMLTGTLPFDDSNVSILFKKIQTSDYPPPRHVSREATDLIKKMLFVNPLERATMEQVMQHPWMKPHFPQYVLSLHYEAVLDTMRFAKDHTVSEEMLDEEVVRVVASRFRITPQQVVAIVTREEEKMPSMWAVPTEEASGSVITRRYPAAHYWETFSNVLDSKLWPAPLEVMPAEVALRDESHDILVSYLILTQKEQNKLGPEEYARRSFGNNPTNLLQSQSQQGYGSLNANSLHQLSANSSFTGSSFAGGGALTRQKGDRRAGEKSFLSLPDKSASVPEPSLTAPGGPDDHWMEGYNYLSAPFLPLHHEQSQHTLLGGLLHVNELPVSLMRARNLDVHAVPRANPQLDSAPGSLMNSSMPNGIAMNNASTSLLHPMGTAEVSANDEEPLGGATISQRPSLLRPMTCDGNKRGSTGGHTPTHSPNASGSRVASTAHVPAMTGAGDSRRCSGGNSGSGASPPTVADGNTTSSSCGAARGKSRVPEQETVLETLYRVDVATRFGNDFIRNGVLFRSTSPHDTLRATYAAMREEGLLWRVIYDYYFSCVRFPNVKLQVKVYKVTKDEQIVDVKVSVQSGMESYDAAISLLDRLRTKAVELSNKCSKRPKKRNSLLAHFAALGAAARTPTKSNMSTGSFASTGKGSVASISSGSGVTLKK